VAAGAGPHRAFERRYLPGLLAGGALKDVADETGGAPIASPIFSHPDFERLEAEGLSHNTTHTTQAVKAVSERARA
jgi:hypothetical protein